MLTVRVGAMPLSLALVAVLALGLITGARAADAAASAELENQEKASLHVRVLQSNLMVASITCRLSDAYNATLTKFENELIRHDDTLRSYFDRVYGTKKGAAKLDHYITDIANEIAVRSSKRRSKYCASARSIFERVLVLSPSDLSGFATETREFGISGALPSPEGD